MAKSKKNEEVRTSIDNLNDSLTSIGEKVQKNQKPLMIATICVVAVVALVLVYVFLMRNPAIDEANTAVGAADREMLINGNDSIALDIYQQVAEDGYDAGNRAKLMAAIQLYQQGKYEEALGFVSEYSAKDAIIGAAAYSLEGDCYVNLDNLDAAVGSFKNAISQSDANPHYTPFFMLKLARVYRAQDNFEGALKLYEEIRADYPNYATANGVNIEKEIEFARVKAGK